MNEFLNNKYKLIKGLVSPSEIKALYNYTMSIEAKGTKGDIQCPLSVAFYKNPKMEELSMNLLPIIEAHTGLNLFNTYTYFRIYKKGEALSRHTDREACEISLTLRVGGNDKWDLWLEDPLTSKHLAVDLEPGDCLLYRGLEVPHWRETFNGNNYVQVFMHFVDQNGPHAAHKGDVICMPPKSNGLS